MSEPLEHPTTTVRYSRTGEWMRITLERVSNHELREMLVGLWARLDADDRVDHINALRHYERVLAGTEDGHLSPIAHAIRTADPAQTNVVDLRALLQRGENITK